MVEAGPRLRDADGVSLAAAALRARAEEPAFCRRLEDARAAMARLGEMNPRVAVSWSGGADSTACVALAAECWSEGLVLMGWHCEDARPEIASLVSEWRDRAPHLEILLRPAVAGWHARGEVADIDPEAERADRERLARLVKRLGIEHMVLGLRRSESRYRARIARTLIDPQTASYRAAEKWGGHTVHCPILEWSRADVETYLASAPALVISHNVC